jgi:iron uptake system component EfeO
MAGEGISATLTVTPGGTGAGAGAAGTTGAPADPRLAGAVDRYRSYVAAQVDSSLAGARQLARAIRAGDLAAARAAYAPSRVGWERIEPVAESFGDLDPRVDARQGDVPAGEPWTGWHRIEQGLFARGTTAGLAPVADQLVADLSELASRVPDAVITPTSMANGAKELLDEVATTKVTGEEEAFSHTDLVDMAANVAGARRVVDLLRPVAEQRDPRLVEQIDRRFEALTTLLDTHRDPDAPGGYVDYDTVEPPARRALSDAVNALAEPLSGLAGAVAGV